MTEQEVLDVMKESQDRAERGAGHIRITYTYPLTLSKSNPGGHNQADCYRESTDALMVGVRTNNMKYAKNNVAAGGAPVTQCPRGFSSPSNPDWWGYFWIHDKTGKTYVRAKYENIRPEYKQRSRYFIDGQEVDYQDVVNAYYNGEFVKEAIVQPTENDLFDRHVAVDRIIDCQVVLKEDFEKLDYADSDYDGGYFDEPISDGEDIYAKYRPKKKEQEEDKSLITEGEIDDSRNSNIMSDINKFNNRLKPEEDFADYLNLAISEKGDMPITELLRTMEALKDANDYEEEPEPTFEDEFEGIDDEYTGM